MNFKTKSLIVLLMLSVIILSSCEVYQTLYQVTPEDTTGDVVAEEETLSEDVIEEETTEEVEETLEEETAVEEELTEEVVEEELTEEDVLIDITLEEISISEETTEEVEETLEEETVVEEELTEEGPREKPIVIVIQETELVSLVTKAEDPDKDTNLVFTFTSPLDENGQWQTTYGDAGEYTITVTASDGELTTTKDVLMIVNKKEEAPIIDSSKPIESGLLIDETGAIDFNVEASDLNNDPLSYLWKLDGIDVGTDSEFTYQSTFEDAGTHTIKVDVSDGLSSASKLWSVDVENVNRLPVLEDIDDFEVDETDTIIITALATDDDGDAIIYAVSGLFEQEDNVFTWQTDYDSAGTYEVTVSASDGQDTTEQTFTVTVSNMNRPPVILDIVQQ